ncbi:hypothetical protein MUK72_17850 (plasmid) [Halococcus dombrowskii]|uniref:Uncharacterized protein n=1 Tax=Halococcus dombrowskii TaxID=179637 RepID=A0AAV3SGS2_HALDO|nr:hypothetical protein [Halococcus dombrowskii]UOO97132.1 hypothetical protein MUK72_17850 [Halococcus dombrowskii]
MSDDNEETIETRLRSALDAGNEEQARELAADLWADRDMTGLEVIDSGDCGTVEVTKDGFLGMFSVVVDREGCPRASETGIVAFERHDDEGYHLIEDVEAHASAEVLDRMNDALDASVEQYRERRTRRKEFRRMVL